MKIFITGGFGFIGSQFIRSNIKNNKIINIDKITYASQKLAIQEFKNIQNCRSFKIDICNEKKIKEILFNFKPNVIINFAAESHVDQSIDKPDNFIKSNINGVLSLLKISTEYYRSLSLNKKNQFKFIQISTDEVFGSLKKNDRKFVESSNYYPNSPYSASKASSDHLVRAWNKTFNLPTIVTHCSNNFGPYQNYEKLIPNVILRAIQLQPILIYGKGNQIRDWIYVEDHVNAIKKVINQGKPGETYNIGGDNEIKNIELVKKICDQLDKILPINNNSRIKKYSNLITHVEDRPAHDQRYAINCSKIKKNLNWKVENSFEASLNFTIKWYLENFNNKKINLERKGIAKK